MKTRTWKGCSRSRQGYQFDEAEQLARLAEQLPRRLDRPPLPELWDVAKSKREAWSRNVTVEELFALFHQAIETTEQTELTDSYKHFFSAVMLSTIVNYYRQSKSDTGRGGSTKFCGPRKTERHHPAQTHIDPERLEDYERWLLALRAGGMTYREIAETASLKDEKAAQRTVGAIAKKAAVA